MRHKPQLRAVCESRDEEKPAPGLSILNLRKVMLDGWNQINGGYLENFIRIPATEGM